VPSDQRLIYEQSIEGMYLKGHPEKLTPQLKAALKEHGIDLDQKLKPFYLADAVNAATVTFRKLAYGHIADDAEAYAQIGARTVDGYFDTVYGRPLVGLLKLFGVKRIVDRLPQAMTGSSNFMQVTVEWKGPNEAHLTLSDTDPNPYLNLGVLRRAFRHWFKTPSFDVAIHEHVRPRTTFRLTWNG
jgi:uncharacterized protein (TIGR02265 family)